MMGLAFEVFRDDIDSSLEHYQRQSEKNRLNGKKGAVARWGGTNSKRHDLNSKNSQSEGEGDEEADTEADTDVSLSCTADAVSNHFIALFHREPSKEFLKTVKQSSLGEQDILLAIERSKSVEIQNPEGYATRLLQAWEHTGVPNQTQKETPSESQQMEEWEKEWLAEFRAEQAALDRENL